MAHAKLTDDSSVWVALAYSIKGDPEPTVMRPKYVDFEDVASEINTGILAPHEAHDHDIVLEPGTSPPHQPIYNLSEHELKVLWEYIETVLNKGWIQPSTSPVGAPIIFVPKKDGSLWLCVDYCRLNSIIVKNCYSLLLVSEILDRLSSTKIYTKLDLRDAYHCIQIKKGKEWMTAFWTRYGHFKYIVMLFRLTNAPATFQAYINHALSNLLDICCIIYLNDILIFSNSEEEHVHHVWEVLKQLWKFWLYIKASKYKWHTTCMGYLRFVITPNGIEMEQDWVTTIDDWPEPRSVWEILMFVGFANFYWWFIKGYSCITLPLLELMYQEKKNEGETILQIKKQHSPLLKNKREVKYEWGVFLDKEFQLLLKAREAFKHLKAAFMKALLLVWQRVEFDLRVWDQVQVMSWVRVESMDSFAKMSRTPELWVSSSSLKPGLELEYHLPK